MEEKARWDDNSERSLMPEGLVNWQPIETAPKDGSKVLVYLACAPSQREWDAWHIYLERYTIGFWLHGKPGLVELIQTELKTFRASASIQGELDFRELAVSLVRVFRDYIEAEIKRPYPYDTEEPSKGQGWE
jgi:hypothetical protein